MHNKQQQLNMHKLLQPPIVRPKGDCKRYQNSLEPPVLNSPKSLSPARDINPKSHVPQTPLSPRAPSPRNRTRIVSPDSDPSQKTNN